MNETKKTPDPERLSRSLQLANQLTDDLKRLTQPTVPKDEMGDVFATLNQTQEEILQHGPAEIVNVLNFQITDAKDKGINTPEDLSKLTDLYQSRGFAISIILKRLNSALEQSLK